MANITFGSEVYTWFMQEKGKAYDNRTQAPVFEFRRMAGSQPHRVWPALAVDIFDYIRKLNNKGDAPIDVDWTEQALMLPDFWQVRL